MTRFFQTEVCDWGAEEEIINSAQRSNLYQKFVIQIARLTLRFKSHSHSPSHQFSLPPDLLKP
jgi:hypothetical protein